MSWDEMSQQRVIEVAKLRFGTTTAGGTFPMFFSFILLSARRSHRRNGNLDSLNCVGDNLSSLLFRQRRLAKVVLIGVGDFFYSFFPSPGFSSNFQFSTRQVTWTWLFKRLKVPLIIITPHFFSINIFNFFFIYFLSL